jgi:hypothetical protein
VIEDLTALLAQAFVYATMLAFATPLLLGVLYLRRMLQAVSRVAMLLELGLRGAASDPAPPENVTPMRRTWRAP